MKKLVLFINTLIVCLTLTAQKGDTAFYAATKTWFSAWQLVSQELYQIDTVKPVDFVFFDEKYVYSTSATTIPYGESVDGYHLINQRLQWKKALHNDSLTLPDKTVVPIGLMSFASVMPNDPDKAFFVMPLPGFWRNAGVVSNELGLGHLITGVFIHEFSHAQQMQNFGKAMTALEKQQNFGVPFSDDIVQDLFSKDTNYTKLFHIEVETFYRASQGKVVEKALVKKGLKMMRKRQARFFQNQFAGLSKTDKFFLTMEGLGQYSMYLWLIHPKGGNINKALAIKGVRRNKKQWSQDEGFALFLILDKITTPATWASKMFGDEIETVTALIDAKAK